jgi:hypothetical protein
MDLLRSAQYFNLSLFCNCGILAVRKFELRRSIVLNPISHAAITNTYRREIEDSINIIEELENELKRP